MMQYTGKHNETDGLSFYSNDIVNSYLPLYEVLVEILSRAFYKSF